MQPQSGASAGAGAEQRPFGGKSPRVPARKRVVRAGDKVRGGIGGVRGQRKSGLRAIP